MAKQAGMQSLKCHDCGRIHVGACAEVAPVALTAAEQRELVKCEAVIERGLAGFVEVGEALAKVRDRKLYRREHKTFQDYCQARWGFSRPRAYQIMDGAEVAVKMSTMVDKTKLNERQSRALKPLKDDPDAMAEAYEDAGPEPTAGAIRKAVDRKLKREPAARSLPPRPPRPRDDPDRELGEPKRCPNCGAVL